MIGRTKRYLRIVVAAVAVAVLALAATVFVRRELAARRYAAIVEQLDRDDLYWRLDELAAQLRATPLPDAENLAVPLAAARAAVVRPAPEWNERRANLIVDLVPNVRLTRDQSRVVIDGIEANEDAILPALELDQFPRGRHTIVFTADGISTLFRHIDDIGQVATVVDDVRLAAVHRGDAATALRAFRMSLNLGRSLREEPAAISQFMRARHRKEAVRGLERLLGHVVLTDEQLAAAGRELRAELDDDLWPLAARGELALIDRFMTAVRTGVLKPSTLKRLSSVTPPSTPADRAADWVRDRIGIDVIAEHAELLELEARAVAVARLPWPERWAALQTLPSKEDQSQAEIVRLLTPNFPGLFGRFALDEARVRCALAAVAVERHRMATGDWPKTLTDVGPQPADPLTGQPLLYKRLADGVVVYSVGPDRIDDGGALAETSGSLMAPTTDIGVRLWDVPQRNRPALRQNAP